MSGGTNAISYDILEGVALHLNVKGKTVLGVGSYDGRHVATTLDRGAASVTVVDSGQWEMYGWSPPAQYEGVTYVTADVMDYHTPADIVECANVCYHSKAPWLLFEHLRALTRECLVLTTSFVPGDDNAWVIQPYNPADGPRHVWYKPTLNGLYEMLRCTGFPQWEVVGITGDHIIMRCKPG